jgi:transposase
LGMLTGMPTLADRLVPDTLWYRVAPLLPPPPPRLHGGRRRTIPDRACFAAIVFMARTSTPWELLPATELGCGSASTAYRRFAAWTKAGVFDRLTLVLLDELGEAGRIDWSRISVDSASLRAVKRGTTPAQTRLTGESTAARSTSPSTAPASPWSYC